MRGRWFIPAIWVCCTLALEVALQEALGCCGVFGCSEKIVNLVLLYGSNITS